MRRLLPLLVALALFLSACGASGGSSTSPSDGGNEGGVDVINFTLNWFPLADHAAYYVAQEKGYYTDAGLAVNILQGSGSGESLRRVNIGQADLGLADTGVIVNGIRSDATVKMVMMVMDRGWAAIWAKKGSGIEQVSDLCGKKIGAPVADANRALWPALANAQGIDPECVTWVDIQPAAKYQTLSSGSVDAILDAVTGAPFVYEALGGEENAVQITYADNGVDVPAISMIASEKMISDRPDVIKRFIDATLKGWQDVFDDPEAALTIEQKYWPSLEMETYLVNLQLVESLMRTDNFKQNGVGHFDDEKMASAMDTLQQYFDAPGTIDDPKTTYTNEYVTSKIEPPAE